MSRLHKHLSAVPFWLAVLDAACLLVGATIALTFRLGHEEIPEYISTKLYGWLYLLGSILLANYVSGTYGIQLRISRLNIVVNWVFSLVAALAFTSLTSYAWFELILGRGVLVLTLLIYSALWLSVRFILYNYIFQTPMFTYRVVIIGGDAARVEQLKATVENELIRPRHRVVAVMHLLQQPHSCAVSVPEGEGLPHLAVDAAHIAESVRRFKAEVVVLGAALDHDMLVYFQLRRLRFEGVAILTALRAVEIYHGRLPVDLIDEVTLMEAADRAAAPVALRFKRIMDVIAATFGGLLVLPIGLLIALLIKLSAPRSPVLYTQMRVGRFGKPFRIYKFRTMVQDAEKDNEAVWAAVNDSRVTLIGQFLRMTRLDELPQLINIMVGDMSLVGPRPERPEFVAKLTRLIPYYIERENVKPGLTGWAQVRYPYGASVEDARRKLEYDLYYMKNFSIPLDIQIVLRTFRIVLLGMEHRLI